MKIVEKKDILKFAIIFSPVLAAVLASMKIPVDTGSDNFLVPLGVFIGIPFIAIFGGIVSGLTRNSYKTGTYALLAYAAAAIFVCVQMLFGIMLI